MWGKMNKNSPFVYNKVKRVEAFNCIFTQFGLENMQSQWLPSPDKSEDNYIPNFSWNVILMFPNKMTKQNDKNTNLGLGGGIIIWESWESRGCTPSHYSYIGIQRFLSCSLYYYEWKNIQGF